MIKKITREEEAKLPLFGGHSEAREWFKGQYGDDFMLTGSETYGQDKCYFYDLILDREVYEREQKKLYEGRISDGAIAFLNSYQSIQIHETGEVHIVH